MEAPGSNEDHPGDHRPPEDEKVESLRVLAGGVAHDFNNLLTAILGNASLMRGEIPPGSAAHASLDQIELAADRAAELCRQMLAYSGRGSFHIHRLDLNELVSAVLAALRPAIGDLVAVHVHLSETLPVIHGDGAQLRQLLTNLIINASEAMGGRPGTITVRTGAMYANREYLDGTRLSPDMPEGEYIFLEVADNGCGMTQKTLAKIFDPFFTTKFTGRGLGLAAGLGIIRGHCAALKVVSEPGCGSSFRVLLPGNGARPRQSELPFPRSASISAGTILVVDDEEFVRRLTHQILESAGYEVLLASDGQDGVNKYAESAARIDAVVLDLTMPRMDGAQAFREIRKVRPDARVLVMSGFAEDQVTAHFSDHSPGWFIQKPFRADAFLQRISQVLAEDPRQAGQAMV